MDKNALLTNRVTTNTATVEIEGVGEVTVRGLSRFEFMVADKEHPTDLLARERWVLSKAMIDPEMTERDVLTWQQASAPAEINKVAMEVNRLSGIGPDAAKEAYKSAGE